MKTLKVITLTLAGIAGIFAQQTAQGKIEELPVYTVVSSFDPLVGTLFYEKLDQFGNKVERIEQTYPVPPAAVCDLTKWSKFMNMIVEARILPPNIENLDENSYLQCCDYYIPSVGYQFSRCEQDIGPYIFPSKKVNNKIHERYLNEELAYNVIDWSGLF